uniref:Uncharacterized protein n=1 Tax=Arundo donax TaxID=35708 RepID=A0A0A9H9C2_ARUDO
MEIKRSVLQVTHYFILKNCLEAFLMQADVILIFGL